MSRDLSFDGKDRNVSPIRDNLLFHEAQTMLDARKLIEVLDEDGIIADALHYRPKTFKAVFYAMIGDVPFAVEVREPEFWLYTFVTLVDAHKLGEGLDFEELIGDCYTCSTLTEAIAFIKGVMDNESAANEDEEDDSEPWKDMLE